jgi:arylsulfatase A-like enzyme
MRTRAWVAASAVSLAAGALAAAAAGPTAAQEPGPPNVIVIMSDDQGPGMMRALPTVQRELGTKGTTFTNAFSSFPLCCPARATLLTGEYAHNHGTLGNNPLSGGGYQALREPGKNLARWLQANGYATGFAGKWLNGLRSPRAAPRGWDQWSGLIGEGGDGLSSYYDFSIFEPDGTPRHYGDRAADYQTDVLTRDYAVPFINAQAVDPRPFFLWLAYHPPHSGVGRNDLAGRRCSDGPPDERGSKQSAIPPKRYARRYISARVPRSPSFDERDVTDKPKLVSRRPPLSDRDLETIDRDYRCGLAALRALDDGVGQIVDELRATGQLANTVLIFLTDHGVMAGEHRIKRGKNRPYEEAIGIPLLIRGPGVFPGGGVEAPVANIDLAPTILDLAAAEVPSGLARPIDGVSLRPTLTGVPADPDRAILIEGRDKAERSRHGFKVTSYVGVRTARYAYFEYHRAGYDTQAEGIAAPIGAGRRTERELYDLVRDPNQLRNLSRDPGYGFIRTELAGLVKRLENCEGSTCAVSAELGKPRRVFMLAN